MTAPNRTHPDFDYCYGASEVGSCVTAQVARRLEYDPLPPPAVVQGWFDRGHEHEVECLAAMAGDWTLGDQQAEFTIDCGRRVGVIVHVDAMGERADNRHQSYVIECKAPGTWAKFERAVRTADFSDPLMHRYAWQVSCQMVATGLECVVACVEEGQVRTFGIEMPIFDRQAIIDRVCVIEGIASLGTLPSCAGPDWPCPFAYLHSPSEPRTELDDPVLFDSIEKYVSLGERIKELEAERKIEYGWLQALGVGRYAAGPHAVTVYEQAGATTLDKAAMAVDGIDLALYEKVGKPSVRAKVTRRGED